uniref:AN1-type domain-containing protein n=1 Tax=Angiostrongylus cantonensis TaxID=6313 RepID=A0A0K0CTZ4_ANGCA
MTNIRLPRKPRSPVDKKHSEWTPEKQMEHEITRNRMKVSGIYNKGVQAFFEPPETVIEMELRKKHFLLAPSNMEELNAVKARREALLKTVCKVCNGKLKPAEQQMPCACSYVFCKHHRKPDTHLCNIDHRQMGRSKISKENPKMVFGGIRKAKMTPHP